MLILPSTNKRLHVLLNKSGNMAHKEDMVYSFTGGRTDRSRLMTDDEARAMIAHLQSLADDKANRMRRKIFAICHTLGWYMRDKNHELILNNGRPVIDTDRIDAFCLQRGPFKKPLQEHTAKELTTLVTVFERL